MLEIATSNIFRYFGYKLDIISHRISGYLDIYFHQFTASSNICKYLDIYVLDIVTPSVSRSRFWSHLLQQKKRCPGIVTSHYITSYYITLH